MTNDAIADTFTLLAKLMDIHGENAFKIKTYSIAAYNIEKTEQQLSTLTPEQLYATKGIGTSIGSKVTELLTTGTLQQLEQLIAATPQGIIDMMHIKGLGPKKITTIWKELGIESIGELLYACNENRLLLYKGFGAKNQQSIKESIEFYNNAQGSYLYAKVVEVLPEITSYVAAIFAPIQVTLTGAVPMQRSTIDTLEYIVHLPLGTIIDIITAQEHISVVHTHTSLICFKYTGIPLSITIYSSYINGIHMPIKQELITSSSLEFFNAFDATYHSIDYAKAYSIADAFAQASLSYIPAYARELPQTIELAKQGKLPNVIQATSIKGMIHNHSNWSDGAHTIQEMAEACIALGYEYLVISDHSKSAYYAKGLSEDRIKEQHVLINQLNKQYAPFKIFKSIECDILNDGSLDYSDAILSTFDLVIASVHSNLKMTQEKAMQRLLTAVENPYTTILGHLTGRLLLSRPGYPVQYERIIEACATNYVSIELNAHPSRLDVDWQYIPSILASDVLISINPDAHSTNGFGVVTYGVLAAQKGLLTAAQNLSSFSLHDFEEYIYEIRERKGV